MPMESIDHVVVLMLENRSFDHMLGDLSLGGKRKDVDGLADGMSNPDSSGGTVKIKAVTDERFLTDAGHGYTDVQEQLGMIGGKPNQGFVRNYAKRFEPKKVKLGNEIMHYQTKKTVPIHYLLADEYAISDTWFCSVPSETWPNRVFTAGATTNGRLRNGLPLYNIPTVFSRLQDKGLEWAVYNDQFPNVLNIKHLAAEFLRSRHKAASRFRSMKQFEDDCASDKLRPYSFIEPIYFFGGANDDHPPHDIHKGQLLIARTYLAIRRSPAWNKTVLIITDDEHGGFFDHVPPPKGIPAPKLPAKTDSDFKFDQLGPRVPLLLIAPWVSKKKVFRTAPGEFFDHTSIISSVSKRFGLPSLTARDKAARDFWFALDLAQPRSDDQETFRKIETWYNAERITEGLEAVEEQEMVGESGREVAARIAAEGTARTLESVPEVSDFQSSMEDLAAYISMEAPAIQREGARPPKPKPRSRKAPSKKPRKPRGR